MDKRLQELEWMLVQRKSALVERAERLASSEAWRETARAFREMGRAWREIDADAGRRAGDPLWQRFQTARQTFMDRRAGHYQDGSLEQGAMVHGEMDRLQQQLETLRDTVRDQYRRLERLERQPAEKGGLTAGERAALRERVALNELKLRQMENNLIAMERRFCGY